MKHNSFLYSLKVWLTSVVLSPVIYVLLLAIRQVADLREMLNTGIWMISEYIIFVVAQFIFSFITWILFVAVILISARISMAQTFRKWIIFFAGIGLTVATFILMLSPFDLFNDANGLINLMYANCFCIGWGVWYYNLRAAPAAA